jgi:cell division protease FtsH
VSAVRDTPTFPGLRRRPRGRGRRLAVLAVRRGAAVPLAMAVFLAPWALGLAATLPDGSPRGRGARLLAPLGQIVAGRAPFAESTRAIVDSEIESMVAAAYADALEVVTTHRDALERLTRRLVESHVLERVDIVAAIGPPAAPERRRPRPAPEPVPAPVPRPRPATGGLSVAAAVAHHAASWVQP